MKARDIMTSPVITVAPETTVQEVAALLYERNEFMLAGAYVIGSVVLSIAGLFAGLAVVRHLT